MACFRVVFFSLLVVALAVEGNNFAEEACGQETSACSEAEVEMQESEELEGLKQVLLQVKGTMEPVDNLSKDVGKFGEEVAKQELVIDMYAHTEKQLKNASLMFKDFQAAVATKGITCVDLKKLFNKSSVTMETKAGHIIGQDNATKLSVLEPGDYPLKLRFVFKHKADLSESEEILHAVSNKAAVNATLDVRGSSQWEVDQFMTHTNFRRCIHAVPPLRWNWDLHWEAAWHAYHMQYYNEMYHAQLTYQGENLFWSSASYTSPENVVESWYAECHNCDGGEWGHAPGCRSWDGVVGHYTALIWAGATSMGCAYSESTRYAVCRYMDSTNVDCNTPNCQGCYEQNVPPKSRNWWDCV